MIAMFVSKTPAAASWRHQGARAGFEVVFFCPVYRGWNIDGCTTAVEGGETWAVEYFITVDETWTTRSARISGRSASGSRSLVLEADGEGHWLVDGESAPHLGGCFDIDLESSAMTNSLPVHRMSLEVGAASAVPAAYVRALDLTVERLDQIYVRAADQGSLQRYDYTAPAFDFACRLVYDHSGLVLDYPGIAVRTGPGFEDPTGRACIAT